MAAEALKALSSTEQLSKDLKRVNTDEEESPVRVVLLSSTIEVMTYAHDRFDASLRSFPALPAALFPEEWPPHLQGLHVDVLFDVERVAFGCDAFWPTQPQRSAGLARLDGEGQLSAFFGEGGYETLPGLEEFGEALRAAPDLPELPLMAEEGSLALRLLCSPELNGDARRAQTAQRLQLLSALCVDNGVAADMSCSGWWVGLFFAEGQLAGFITLFSFPTRRGGFKLRVSQALVFEPFRRRGLCGLALRAIYDRFLAVEDCECVTVEAPTLYFQTLRFRHLLRRLSVDAVLLAAVATCRENGYGDAPALLPAVQRAAKAGREAAERLLHLLIFHEATQAGKMAEFEVFYLARIQRLKAERASHAKTAFRRKFVSFEGQPVPRIELKRLLCEFEAQGGSAQDVLADELARFAEICGATG